MRYENSNCMTFCILGHVLPGHMDRRRGPGLPTFGVPVGPWTAGFLTPLNVSDLLTADVTGDSVVQPGQAGLGRPCRMVPAGMYEAGPEMIIAV